MKPVENISYRERVSERFIRHEGDSKELIDACLNCAKPTCNNPGICKTVKEFKRKERTEKCKKTD